MSRADHPAGKGLRCADCCNQPAAARVAVPAGFAVIRPLNHPNPVGDLLCLDCAHTAIDVMLLRATPKPTR